MNATFLAVGLIHWVGAVAIQSAWTLNGRRLAATVLLVLAGVSLYIVGLAPENVPRPSA